MQKMLPGAAKGCISLHCDGGGSEQLHSVQFDLCRGSSSSHKAARDLLRRMDANGDHAIDVNEFLAFMHTALDDISDELVDNRVQALVEERLAGRFQFDFSGSYCGPRGVLPLIAALTLDHTFESLDLSGCGIDNHGAELLAGLLESHPVRSPWETTEFKSAYHV